MPDKEFIEKFIDLYNTYQQVDAAIEEKELEQERISEKRRKLYFFIEGFASSLLGQSKLDYGDITNSDIFSILAKIDDDFDKVYNEFKRIDSLLDEINAEIRVLRETRKQIGLKICDLLGITEDVLSTYYFDRLINRLARLIKGETNSKKVDYLRKRAREVLRDV